MDASQVRACLGDVRRTLKAYAAHGVPPGILPERVLGALGAAWTETVRDLGGGDKDAAFVWGGGEKFARLLTDTCVHRLVFRDEPGAAGNRLAADALMTLQDLATARVPLGRDAETVALAACAAFMNHVTKSDDALEAAARLTANAPGPSEDARAIAKRGLIRLGGRTGYESALKGAGIGEGGRAGSSGGRDRFDRGSDRESGGGFYDGRRGGYDDRRDDRYDDDRYERRSPRQQARKSGDWDCAECGFMNFASRRECKQCGSPGGGGAMRGPVSSVRRRRRVRCRARRVAVVRVARPRRRTRPSPGTGSVPVAGSAASRRG